MTGVGYNRRTGFLNAIGSGGGASARVYLLAAADAAFTRSTASLYQTSASALAVAAADAIIYEDLGDGFGPLLSIERQWSQLCPTVRQPSAGWVGPPGGSTFALSGTSPDGTSNSMRANVASGGYGKGCNNNITVTTATPIVGSWWWRATSGTSDAQQTIFTAVVTGATKRVTGLTTTWARASSAPFTSSDTTLSYFIADGRSLPSLTPAATAMAMDVLADLHNIREGRYTLRTVDIVGTVSPDDMSFAEGDWDTRLASSTWTIEVVTKWASTALVSGDQRWILSFGGSNDGVRFYHDGTGVRVECLDGGSVVAASGYLTFATTDKLTIVIAPATSQVTVNGVAGSTAAALTWPTTGALRLGGIHGAAAGSGEEVDARMSFPFLGDGGDGSRLPVVVGHLGDSITVAAGGRAELYSDASAASARIVSIGAYSGGTYPANLHSGINGNTIEQMEARISTDITPYAPEVIIVHAGTNNLPSDSAATMAAKLSSLLSALRAAVPGAYIIACQIPPRTSYETKVSDYNALIPGVVSALADSRIVQINPGLTAGDISGDGIHPSAAGYLVLGSAWWTLGVEPYLALPRPTS